MAAISIEQNGESRSCPTVPTAPTAPLKATYPFHNLFTRLLHSPHAQIPSDDTNNHHSLAQTHSPNGTATVLPQTSQTRGRFLLNNSQFGQKKRPFDAIDISSECSVGVDAKGVRAHRSPTAILKALKFYDQQILRSISVADEEEQRRQCSYSSIHLSEVPLLESSVQIQRGGNSLTASAATTYSNDCFRFFQSSTSAYHHIFPICSPSSDCGMTGVLFHFCHELAAINCPLPKSVMWIRPKSKPLTQLPTLPQFAEISDRILKEITIISVSSFSELLGIICGFSSSSSTMNPLTHTNNNIHSSPPACLIIEDVLEILKDINESNKAHSLFELAHHLQQFDAFIRMTLPGKFSQIYVEFRGCTENIQTAIDALRSSAVASSSSSSSLADDLRDLAEVCHHEAVHRFDSSNSHSESYLSTIAPMRWEGTFAHFLLSFFQEIIWIEDLHINPPATVASSFASSSCSSLTVSPTFRLSVHRCGQGILLPDLLGDEHRVPQPHITFVYDQKSTRITAFEV